FRIDLLREALVAHQFADANAGATAFWSYAAADALELVCRLARTLGREAQQCLTRGRRGLADLHAAAHDAAASGGWPLIRRQCRVAFDQRNGADVEARLFRAGLAERNARALPETGLGARDPGEAVAM